MLFQIRNLRRYAAGVGAAGGKARGRTRLWRDTEEEEEGEVEGVVGEAVVVGAEEEGGEVGAGVVNDSQLSS